MEKFRPNKNVDINSILESQIKSVMTFDVYVKVTVLWYFNRILSLALILSKFMLYCNHKHYDLKYCQYRTVLNCSIFKYLTVLTDWECFELIHFY